MCYACRIVLVCAAATAIVVSAGCTPTNTAEEQQVLNFANDTFGEIRNMIDPADSSPMTTKFIGNHVEVSSQQWSYVLDESGLQTFRAKQTYPMLKVAFTRDISKTVDQWRDQPVPKAMVDEATQLAESIVGVNYAALPAVAAMPTRELLMSMPAGAKAGSGDVKYYEGRTAVLFSPPVSEDALVEGFETVFMDAAGVGAQVSVEPVSRAKRSHETAITFAPGGEMIRAESTFMTPAVRDVVDVLRDGLATGAIRPEVAVFDPGLKFGTFFDPEETRFELSSYSWEGEDFLIPDTILACDASTYSPGCNPYYSEFFPIAWCFNDTGGDVGYYRTLDQYKYWVWYWWLLYGRENGVRGNWIASQGAWEHDVDIRIHRSLDSYNLTTTLTQTAPVTTCDGVTLTVPHGTDLKLEQAFFDDLERCHVVEIATHGVLHTKWTGRLPCAQGL